MSFNLLLKAQLQRFVDKLFPQIYSYGTCSTAKETVAKVVTLNGFILKTGARISVRFSSSSSTSPSSGNITLNVNNTGAKNVILANSNNQNCTYEYADDFFGNKVQQFVYDGTYWVYLLPSIDTSAIETIMPEMTLINSYEGLSNLTFSSLLDQVYSDLADLTDEELWNCVLFENDDWSYYRVFKFQTKLNTVNDEYAYLFTNTFEKAIYETSQNYFFNSAMIRIDNPLNSSSAYSYTQVMANSTTTTNKSSDNTKGIWFYLYVSKSTTADALITTTEFNEFT